MLGDIKPGTIWSHFSLTSETSFDFSFLNEATDFSFLNEATDFSFLNKAT